MSKYCMNYETGDYQWINEDGFSIDRGEYVYNWDYRWKEEKEYCEEAELDCWDWDSCQ